jgi:tRNA(Ile)-lysidine synthetase-like protein
VQSLTNKVKAYVFDNNLEELSIAVASSGGLDSMVLLQILSEVYEPEKVFVLHCDHAWHDASTQISESLGAYCRGRGFNYVSEKFDFSNLKKNEENARDLRFHFFIQKAAELGIKDLFMGHHLDDNVETILFRLFRGTGITGLKGIPSMNLLESSGLVIHRPLLKFEKSQLQEYAKDFNLTVWEDPSNASDIYSRNRIRLNIFPEAEKINPKFKNNINRLALLVGEQEAYINIQVESTVKQLGSLPWTLESFRGLEQLVQRRLLERFFTTNIDFQNDFMEAVQKGGFHRINFSKDRFFTIKQKKIYLEVAADFQ